jgi:glycerol-3-phosphate O-acyltransferase/dihydroxyacetone phosphate acyltransferase
MFTRKSQTADSSVLSHPILWLDERIFGGSASTAKYASMWLTSGWNRSAAVGQSVWGGTKMDRTRSEPSTAPASPAESDDEEYEADVDYDDVSYSGTPIYAGPV